MYPLKMLQTKSDSHSDYTDLRHPNIWNPGSNPARNANVCPV